MPARTLDLLNAFVCARKQCDRYGQTKPLGRLETDRKFDLGRAFNRQLRISASAEA
jgi:hypothetical protein